MIKLLPYFIVVVPVVVALLGLIIMSALARARVGPTERLSTPSPPDSNQKEKGFESEEPINPKSRKIRWE